MATLDTLIEQATRYTEAGQWDDARQGWLRALAMAPDSAALMLELSYLESLAGRYRPARNWALRAAQAGTNLSVDAALSLVRRLRTFNEVPALRQRVFAWLPEAQTPCGLLVECARQLSILNDFPLALQCAEAAVGKAPDDVAARLVRGQLFAQHARIEDAAADFQWVLARNPRIAIGWWLLARLHTQSTHANHVPQLRQLAAMPGLRPADAAAVARALHKELDDLGDHDGAWRALEHLCTIKRATEPYDPTETRLLFEALNAWPGAKASQDGKTSQAPGVHAVPIFIVGMHRSGTTLLEQLLDASAQVRALGELADFTSAMRAATDHYCKGTIDRTIVARAAQVDFASVGDHYLAGVAWRLGDETCFTDKQPANILNLGFICQALPQAKIVHLVRDPMETCFSNLRELFTDINGFSYDQEALADYFLQYRRLMAHWHEAYPGRILDVDYARLTTNPQSTMREVAEFCDIDYVDAMCSTAASSRVVATASSIQVREGVTRQKVPKWMPYARYLQPLMRRLRAGGIDFADPSA